VPLNYADYYFIEGLMRWNQQQKNSKAGATSKTTGKAATKKPVKK
jgi:hypothetical protein